MKIKTDEPSRIATENASKRPKQDLATDFGELLQRTIDRAKVHARQVTFSAGEAQKMNATDLGVTGGIRASDIGSVEYITSGSIDEQHGPILERVEQLLDTIEEYQRNLGNPSTPPESLHSLVGLMEEQNKSLAAVLVALPDTDNLKDILNRVLITSVVEVEKFKRGDYS